MNIDKVKKLTIEEIKRDDSPYFCLSATLLTLQEAISSIKKEIKVTREDIKELVNLLERLEREDATLFSITKEKYIDSQGYQVVDEIIIDYTALFEEIIPIYQVYISLKDHPLDHLIKNSLVFIYETLRESLEGLLDRENLPEATRRNCNYLLIESREVSSL